MGDKKDKITLSNLPTVPVTSGLYWEGLFEEYLTKVAEYPQTIKTAHQRLFDAVVFYGTERYQFLRREVVRYKVCDDPFTEDHRHAIYGRNVDSAIMRFMKVLRAAAQGLGQERRITLLRGPVGSAKSTFTQLLADALESFVKKDEGQLFAPYWVVEDGDEEGREIIGTITRKFERNIMLCPLHEEPIRILPTEIRLPVIEAIKGRVNASLIKHDFLIEGDACPICAAIFEKFMRRYNHDWKKVIEKHLRVKRLILSEKSRKGIVFARPKSEKDQDVTEFLGSTNYAVLGAYGVQTDPRTFDFSGHYQASNRGMFCWEEMLKFALAFLYDCLGASQEHKVQPKGFSQIDIDVVLIGSTNEPEYKKLQQDDKMEALRDRIIVIDVPYILKHSDEIRIYSKFFGLSKRGGKHLAPRTLYIAAYWALLTRLKKPGKANLDQRGKLALYDGRQVPGFTEDMIKELQAEAEGEGSTGISPRYIHDKVSSALMAEDDKGCVNAFGVFNELKDGLANHQHIKSPEQRKEWEKLIDYAKEEFNERLAEDIQEAATSGAEEIVELFERYLEQITAFANKDKVEDPHTRELIEPDEQFMQSIEDKIDITDHDDFRQKILNQMSKRALDCQRDSKKPPFDYKSDERLHRALRLYLFDQVRNKIGWERIGPQGVVASSKDKDETRTEEQRIVDKIRNRLMSGKFGPEGESYCSVCAGSVLSYYASVFVRNKKKEKEA